jgi:hypothetical protein
MGRRFFICSNTKVPKELVPNPEEAKRSSNSLDFLGDNMVYFLFENVHMSICIKTMFLMFITSEPDV